VLFRASVRTSRTNGGICMKACCEYENSSQAFIVARLLRVLVLPCLLVGTIFFAACGTLNVNVAEPTAMLEITRSSLNETERPETTTDASAAIAQDSQQRAPLEIAAWYGTIHTVPGSEPSHDYFKPWHLNIWPKYGPAVGLTGGDPSIDAEIDRIRDTDVKATVWGRLTCGVADYGACQLIVTRLTANDGGPLFTPDPVEGWEGTIGDIPVQPGSQENSLHFVLPGGVPALYGISSEDPAIQAELERLAGSSTTIRIWGELLSRTQPLTGSLIDVKRLERVSQP
jgi:hypothetical protein